ncbi:MAG: hypothetical protein DRH10_00935 [Deltaproteobacteria bacterium]|nr:MAG: hypothetical protein DRH10_00935 [Deltaproteobacteria bacterium]RLC88379.1 MAG: hypothetical protein DRJ03_03000 [Chloroflexota bacterium]
MPNCKDRDCKVSLAPGAVYIAARIIEMFDQPTMAIQALKTANLTVDDFSQAAECDLEILRPYMQALPKGK